MYASANTHTSRTGDRRANEGTHTAAASWNCAERESRTRRHWASLVPAGRVSRMRFFIFTFILKKKALSTQLAKY